MDLFIERIDGDTLRVRGRAAAADGDRGGDRGQGPVRARAAGRPRDPPRADRQRGAARRRRRAAGAALRAARLPRDHAGELRRCSTSPAAPSWSTRSASTRIPSRTSSGPIATARSATRPSGRAPDAPRRLPRPAEARLDGRARVGRLGPLRRAARGRPIRTRGFLVTANNRIAPEDYPHHITSDYLDGYRARRIERADRRRSPSTTWRASRRCRRTCSRSRAWRRRAAWPGCGRATSASGGDRAAALLGRADEPRTRSRRRSTRRSRCGLAREVARAAIGDRDLAERWLDRADNGFIAHVTSPWRWQSHLLGAVGGGATRSWSGGPGTSSRSTRCGGRWTTSTTGFGPDPEAWRWGRVHPLVFPHALGAAQPAAGADLQPPARGRRRPGDGRPGRLGPQRPVHRDLGALLADGRRPGAPRALALAGVHRPVRPGRQPPLRRPPGATGSRDGRSRWPARGRGAR